jgi:phospholipase A1
MTRLANGNPDVVVFIPGIMGTELWLGNKCIWPGPVDSLIFRYPYMEELLREDLEPRDIVRKVSISRQYQEVIDLLVACQYVESGDESERTLWIHAYDWRKDNVLAADRLADLLDRIAAAHGADVTIAIIAHSMGGLISRYLLESGVYADRASLRQVQMLVTLATPHRGSPLALLAARGALKRLFLNRDQVQLLASDRRYPSLYQLMPPQGEPFMWDRVASSRYEPLDPYDAAIANGLSLARDNLDSATRFHQKIDLSKRPAGVRYFFFSGTQQTTVTAIYLLRNEKEPWLVTADEMDDAGDGTVPYWSSAMPGVQSAPTAGEHGTIYRSESLQRTLRRLLGAPILAEAAIPAVAIALREPVVTTDIHSATPVPLHVALSFPAGVTSLHADLRVQLQHADDFFASSSDPVSISYDGARADTITIVMNAPAREGIYRVGLFAKGAKSDRPMASDTLFVQRDRDPAPSTATE